MQLAWSDVLLRQRCVVGTAWQECSAHQQAAAQDLLITVCEAPSLGDLLRFHSILSALDGAGGLVLTLEDVHIRARLLATTGGPLILTGPVSLLDHGRVQAMIVDDLVAAGHSLSRATT